MSAKPPRLSRVRFPGIVCDARTLGVNRATLYRMLTGAPGFDSLRTLRRRYNELIQSRGDAKGATR